jgi:hypothetical protein
MVAPSPDKVLAELQRDVDLLEGVVYGVEGQGGILRQIDGLRREIHRNSQAVVLGALSMAGALVALAVAVAFHS